MIRRPIALLALVLVVAVGQAPSSPDGGYYYLNPSEIDLTVLLPPPPDVASAQAHSEELQVASAVAARSPTQFLQAEEASARTVFFYEPSVGPGFTAQRLPVTAGFFGRVGSDTQRIIDAAKLHWNRPRPNGAPKRRGSYPSGHAAFAAISAIILAQLLPSKRDAIFTQARTFAEDRILLGLHYPSDVASGWTAGTLAAYVMMRDRAFQRDYAAAQSELRKANL